MMADRHVLMERQKETALRQGVANFPKDFQANVRIMVYIDSVWLNLQQEFAKAANN